MMLIHYKYLLNVSYISRVASFRAKPTKHVYGDWLYLGFVERFGVFSQTKEQFEQIEQRFNRWLGCIEHITNGST